MKGKTCCVTGHRDLPQNEIHISPVIDAAGKPQLVVQYVPEEERPEDSETSNNGVVGE